MSADINLEFLEKTKKTIFSYEGKIPDGLSHYYKDILEGNNIEMYMQSYSLSEEEIKRYARVCKIKEIYDEISELMDILKTEVDSLDKDEVEEYTSLIDELQTSGESYIDELSEEEIEEELIENSDDINLIIYSNFIDESFDKTVNARSGKEVQSMKFISGLLQTLNKAEYLELRKKGLLHQIHNTEDRKRYFIEGNPIERIGNGSTKVNFIRIPVSEKNKQELKKSINQDLNTLYLVVSYGDFKNEGLDETKFYNDHCLLIKKHFDELVCILDIFKKDFTKDTFPIAMEFISNGYLTTRKITSYLNKKTEENKTL